jgi:hypothetical protein
MEEELTVFILLDQSHYIPLDGPFILSTIPFVRGGGEYMLESKNA